MFLTDSSISFPEAFLTVFCVEQLLTFIVLVLIRSSLCRLWQIILFAATTLVWSIGLLSLAQHLDPVPAGMFAGHLFITTHRRLTILLWTTVVKTRNSTHVEWKLPEIPMKLQKLLECAELSAVEQLCGTSDVSTQTSYATSAYKLLLAPPPRVRKYMINKDSMFDSKWECCKCVWLLWLHTALVVQWWQPVWHTPQVMSDDDDAHDACLPPKTLATKHQPTSKRAAIVFTRAVIKFMALVTCCGVFFLPRATCVSSGVSSLGDYSAIPFLQVWRALLLRDDILVQIILTIARGISLYCLMSFAEDMLTGILTICRCHTFDTFNAPWLSQNSADFWSSRFHIPVHRALYASVYTPTISMTSSRRASILAVFLFSGVWHEYCNFALFGEVDGSQLMFFGIQSLIIFCSFFLRMKASVKKPNSLSEIMNYIELCVMVLSGYFFFYPYAKHGAFERMTSYIFGCL